MKKFRDRPPFTPALRHLLHCFATAFPGLCPIQACGVGGRRLLPRPVDHCPGGDPGTLPNNAPRRPLRLGILLDLGLMSSLSPAFWPRCHTIPLHTCRVTRSSGGPCLSYADWCWHHINGVMSDSRFFFYFFFFFFFFFDVAGPDRLWQDPGICTADLAVPSHTSYPADTGRGTTHTSIHH